MEYLGISPLASVLNLCCGSPVTNPPVSTPRSTPWILASQPDWPRYQDDEGTYLRFDTANDGGIRVERQADSIPALADDLRTDPTINRAQRRSIVDEMSNWLFTRPVQAAVRAAISDESRGVTA